MTNRLRWMAPSSSPFDFCSMLQAQRMLTQGSGGHHETCSDVSSSFCFLLMLPEPLAAQDLASSIVGMWKLVSFVRKEVATGKTAATYGEHPSGYAYYTAPYSSVCQAPSRNLRLGLEPACFWTSGRSTAQRFIKSLIAAPMIKKGVT
jgi:hypothetical protein